MDALIAGGGKGGWNFSSSGLDFGLGFNGFGGFGEVDLSYLRGISGKLHLAERDLTSSRFNHT